MALMIRNVVVGRLRPGVDVSAVAPALAAVAALSVPGRTGSHVGTDLGLRDGSWDFAITADFADEESYRAYDADPEHNRIRTELFGPYCSDFARVQFTIDD